MSSPTPPLAPSPSWSQLWGDVTTLSRSYNKEFFVKNRTTLTTICVIAATIFCLMKSLPTLAVGIIFSSRFDETCDDVFLKIKAFAKEQFAIIESRALFDHVLFAFAIGVAVHYIPTPLKGLVFGTFLPQIIHPPQEPPPPVSITPPDEPSIETEEGEKDTPETGKEKAEDSAEPKEEHTLDAEKTPPLQKQKTRKPLPPKVTAETPRKGGVIGMLWNGAFTAFSPSRNTKPSKVGDKQKKKG